MRMCVQRCFEMFQASFVTCACTIDRNARTKHLSPARALHHFDLQDMVEGSQAARATTEYCHLSRSNLGAGWIHAGVGRCPNFLDRPGQDTITECPKLPNPLPRLLFACLLTCSRQDDQSQTYVLGLDCFLRRLLRLLLRVLVLVTGGLEAW